MAEAVDVGRVRVDVLAQGVRVLEQHAKRLGLVGELERAQRREHRADLAARPGGLVRGLVGGAGADDAEGRRTMNSIKLIPRWLQRLFAHFSSYATEPSRGTLSRSVQQRPRAVTHQPLSCLAVQRSKAHARVQRTPCSLLTTALPSCASLPAGRRRTTAAALCHARRDTRISRGSAPPCGTHPEDPSSRGARCCRDSPPDQPGAPRHPAHAFANRRDHARQLCRRRRLDEVKPCRPPGSVACSRRRSRDACHVRRGSYLAENLELACNAYERSCETSRARRSDSAVAGHSGADLMVPTGRWRGIQPAGRFRVARAKRGVAGGCAPGRLASV